MDQSRFRDKAYLVTYDLTTELFELYGVKVDDIVPIRSVYILYTDKGVKVLKKVNYSLEELEFINTVALHCKSNGYENVVPFLNTQDGDYYVKREDGTYVMLDMVEGREADYQNPIDLAMVSKSLCRLHNSTKGIQGVIDRRNNLYKWIPEFNKRAQELQKFIEISNMHEIKSDFDKLYLEYAGKYCEDALHSIELLKSSPYEKLCDESKGNINICHHDLAYHNILIDEKSDVHFVDFDLCLADLRVHDIGNLIVKSIKYCSWDIEKAKEIVKSYNSIDELRKEELQVLYAFLTFPQDFYEVSRQYYMRTKKWEEEDFVARLERKALYYNDRKVFLNCMQDMIK